MEKMQIMNLNKLNRRQHEYVMRLITGPVKKYVAILAIWEDKSEPLSFRIQTIEALEGCPASELTN